MCLIKMNYLALLCTLTIVVVLAKNDTRVQIGIRKRAEDCASRTRRGDFVHVHYKGSFDNGTIFDSSDSRGVSFSFTLGNNQVIKGWEQGLIGMCEGERRRLVIPPELAYGKTGTRFIPKDSVLIFEVELIKIENREEL